ncbi:MAG TPA: type II toxin-antitoxin system VapC family toxin [Puia sp.]|nr:type II toxin-antitoxin system VapC family toxin [Puia sp.]
MAFRVFLDANILLDFALKRPEYESARKMIGWVVEGRVEAYVTPAIIHMMAYWMTKSYGTEQTKRVLLALLVDIQVIDISHETTISALHSKMNGIEDALQYYTALHYRLDYFISRDKGLQKEAIPILPVYSPEEFLKSNQ